MYGPLGDGEGGGAEEGDGGGAAGGDHGRQAELLPPLEPRLDKVAPTLDGGGGADHVLEKMVSSRKVTYISRKKPGTFLPDRGTRRPSPWSTPCPAPH